MQYGNIFLVLFVSYISLALAREILRKQKELEKYFSYCTLLRAITSTYHFYFPFFLVYFLPSLHDTLQIVILHFPSLHLAMYCISTTLVSYVVLSSVLWYLLMLPSFLFYHLLSSFILVSSSPFISCYISYLVVLVFFPLFSIGLLSCNFRLISSSIKLIPQ